MTTSSSLPFFFFFFRFFGFLMISGLETRKITLKLIDKIEVFLKLSFLSPFFFISVCSHDFIGEFSTSYRELSRGQSQFNVYEVSFSCMYRNVSVFKFKAEAPMETSVQVLQCVFLGFFLSGTFLLKFNLYVMSCFH